MWIFVHIERVKRINYLTGTLSRWTLQNDDESPMCILMAIHDSLECKHESFVCKLMSHRHVKTDESFCVYADESFCV